MSSRGPMTGRCGRPMASACRIQCRRMPAFHRSTPRPTAFHLTCRSATEGFIASASGRSGRTGSPGFWRRGVSPTQPQVADMHQTFAPPVEQSPVIYQIVLDLEIPVADRCASCAADHRVAGRQVHAHDDGAGGEAADHEHRDRPQRDRRLGQLRAGRQADVAGDGHGGDRFAAGLELPRDLPAVSLLLFQQPQFAPAGDVDRFAGGAVQRPDGSCAVHVCGPIRGCSTRAWRWPPDRPGGCRRPGKRPTIRPSKRRWRSYVAQNLPYTSQTYDSNVPVPLLSAADAATYDGGSFKICDSSPAIEPVYTSPERTFPHRSELARRGVQSSWLPGLVAAADRCAGPVVHAGERVRRLPDLHAPTAITRTCRRPERA